MYVIPRNYPDKIPQQILLKLFPFLSRTTGNAWMLNEEQENLFLSALRQERVSNKFRRHPVETALSGRFKGDYSQPRGSCYWMVNGDTMCVVALPALFPQLPEDKNPLKTGYIRAYPCRNSGYFVENSNESDSLSTVKVGDMLTSIKMELDDAPIHWSYQRG